MYGRTPEPVRPARPATFLLNWKTVNFRQHTYDPKLLPGKHRTASCLSCHPAFQFKGTSTQCESCHRNQPHEDLGGCKLCHSALSWKNVAPDHQTAEPPSIFRVKSRFNHVAHEWQVTARGLKPTCGSCHVGLDFLKRPAMQTCEGCHDGTRAFDALGTQCDRCHEAPPGALLAAFPRSPKTFRHAAHAKLNVKIDDCTSCHGVGIAWEEVQAGHDQHRPCQECHAAEFRKVGQPICLGCHVRNDPFRPNPLRLPSEAGTEWRSPDASELPHAPHIAAGLACAACHPAQSGVAARTPTVGHTVCGKCHEPKRVLMENGPKRARRFRSSAARRATCWRRCRGRAAGNVRGRRAITSATIRTTGRWRAAHVTSSTVRPI